MFTGILDQVIFPPPPPKMSLANGMRNGRGELQICLTIYFPMIRPIKLESSQILSFLKSRFLLEFDLRMELADGKNTELGEKGNFELISILSGWIYSVSLRI